MFSAIIDTYLDLVDWFNSSPWASVFLILKIFSGLMSLAMIAGIVWVNKKMSALGQGDPEIIIPKMPAEQISKSWSAVLEKITSHNPSDWNMAVIQADSILDSILKREFSGETLGERLKQLDVSKLASLDEVWEAHKIRNVIAHDPTRPVSRRDIERAISSYEKALKELEYLV